MPPAIKGSSDQGCPVNWHAVWQYVIGGAIVSWPPVLAGYWLTWRKTRKHVDAATERQNLLIEKLTAQQTRDLMDSGLLAARRAGYHGHGEDSAAPC